MEPKRCVKLRIKKLPLIIIFTDESETMRKLSSFNETLSFCQRTGCFGETAACRVKLTNKCN